MSSSSSSSAPDLGEKENQEVPEEDSGVISKEPTPAPAPVPAPALENLSLANEDSEDKDKGKDTVEPEKEKEDEKDTMTVQTTGSGWGAWGGMTGWNVMEKVNTVVNVAKKKVSYDCFFVG